MSSLPPVALFINFHKQLSYQREGERKSKAVWEKNVFQELQRHPLHIIPLKLPLYVEQL